MEDDEYLNHVAERAIETLDKARRYVDDPSEAPEDADVQEGERGGYFYETESGDTTTDAPMPSGDSGGGGGQEPSDESGGSGEQSLGIADAESYLREFMAGSPHITPNGVDQWVNDLHSQTDGDVTPEDVAETAPDALPEEYVSSMQEALFGGGAGGDYTEDAASRGTSNDDVVTGWSGQHTWGQEVQDAAEGIADSAVEEALEGGAYQSRDSTEVADFAEEAAREYAGEHGVSEEEFVEEVRTIVDSELDEYEHQGER